MSEKQVRFGDIRTRDKDSGNGVPGEAIDNILNTEVVIKGVDTVAGNNGDVLVITLTNGKQYHSGSSVLLRQAEDIVKQTQAGNVVTTTIVQKQSKKHPANHYLTFT
jgi:hypothetical protein